ncbi:uncharacterized protein LOC131236758 [Magnolia sinica]|uniref:uncharacterized protein LOC131236758 n=1 Tax=Magnolia sinica TaxID=86752 RepID=UPI00265B2839|nr:uncharacterized protein LOC131236758 [Magnolia sinica]
MNDLNSEGPKSWSVYTGANPSPSQTAADREAPWKSFGTSMNAISFGFVATAILISMFLIMAIFEHLLRPRASFLSPRNGAEGSLESGPMRSRMHLLEKLGNPPTVATSYSRDFSVMMPGQRYPTFIAQPAPLPCSREGIPWPSHDSGFRSP